MSVLDPKLTIRNLKKKGFVEFTKKSDDHKYLELYHNGKYVLHTKVSHNGDDIRDSLIRAMAFQCKLTKVQFVDLAKCPLSEKEYFDLLERQGALK